jgi:(S)-3,5-dihydroxyphenylglycine transaminase
MDILISDLNECLSSPSLDKVNFLNEVSSMYPDAISFSSGSPSTCTYGVDVFMKHLNNYANYLSNAKGISYAEALTVIGNYASAKGIICDVLAKMLEVKHMLQIRIKMIRR